MEQPHPVRIGRPSVAALERLALAGEEGLNQDISPAQSPPMPYLCNPRTEDRDLLPELTSSAASMSTWPISPIIYTPSPVILEGNKETAETLRALSESVLWCDDALFSSAISAPKAYSLNPDWYGVSATRKPPLEFCLDFDKVPPPARITTSGSTTPSTFGVLLPGPIPTTPTSGEILHTLFPDDMEVILDWNSPFSPAQNAPISTSNGDTITEHEQPYLLLSPTELQLITEEVNPNWETAFSTSPHTALPQTNDLSYSSDIYEEYLATESSEDLKRMWVDIFNGLTEENTAWLNSVPNTFSEDYFTQDSEWRSIGETESNITMQQSHVDAVRIGGYMT